MVVVIGGSIEFQHNAQDVEAHSEQYHDRGTVWVGLIVDPVGKLQQEVGQEKY